MFGEGKSSYVFSGLILQYKVFKRFYPFCPLKHSFADGCDGGCSVSANYALYGLTAQASDFSPSSGSVTITRQGEEAITEMPIVINIDDEVGCFCCKKYNKI